MCLQYDQGDSSKELSADKTKFDDVGEDDEDEETFDDEDDEDIEDETHRYVEIVKNLS